MRCRAAALLLAPALASALAGCGEAARELAAGPGGAAGADALVVALAVRFGPVAREPSFAGLRPKLARAALVPSRVFEDPSAWTLRSGDSREVELRGHVVAGRYRIGVRSPAPAPHDVGDYLARLRLSRTGAGRFEWAMREELAVGSVRPRELAGALGALFRAAESGEADRLRAGAREAFPRSAAAFSRLVRLEALDLSKGREGATAIRLGLRLRPEGLRPSAPRYAAFLEEHFTPMQVSAVARDLSGARWWTLDAMRDLWTLRLRVRDGSLVPLEGPPDRRLPESLRVVIDYSTKAGIFKIGVRRMIAEVTLTRAAHEKGFVARFLEEPDWQLPFLVEPLLRGSLRYPFEGPGSFLSFAVREQQGGPTLLTREYRVHIRESWIVRWLGALTNRAVDEFRRGAEAESDLFSRECLYALRDDLVALLNPSS